MANPDTTKGNSTLVAASTTNDIYYLVACNLENEYTKIFAIKSYPDGIDTLKSSAMTSLVTGGVVTDCTLVGLTNGAQGYAPGGSS